MAEVMRPSERVMSANKAWSTAIGFRSARSLPGGIGHYAFESGGISGIGIA
jgi:hypothetical protein